MTRKKAPASTAPSVEVPPGPILPSGAPPSVSDLIAVVSFPAGIACNGEHFEKGAFIRITEHVSANFARMVERGVLELALASEVPADLIRVAPDEPFDPFVQQKRDALTRKYLKELVAAKVEAELKRDAEEQAETARVASEQGFRLLAARRIKNSRDRAQRAQDLRAEAESLEASSAALMARFGEIPPPEYVEPIPPPPPADPTWHDRVSLGLDNPKLAAAPAPTAPPGPTWVPVDEPSGDADHLSDEYVNAPAPVDELPPTARGTLREASTISAPEIMSAEQFARQN